MRVFQSCEETDLEFSFSHRRHLASDERAGLHEQ